MEQQRDTIMEEREELMVVPSGSNPNPTLRTAHFLKPSPNHPSFDLPNAAFRTNYDNLTNLGCHVAFKGWKKPLKNWNEWVDQMKPHHQSTWRNTGIYDAIIASTYSIGVERDLVLGLGERWCSFTNSFVFPWGETTITLEDAMVLGGFSVLGQSVSSPIEAEAEEDFVLIEEKLNNVRTKMNRTPSRKASQGMWMKFLRGFGSEIEHVGFLVLWLSRYVFPYAHDVVGKRFHKMAFRLARGIRLALAPVVLACLYRDLRLLKENIISVSEKRVTEMLDLWSHMHLVQVWAWERFPTLGPRPNFIGEDESRMARWNQVKGPNVGSVRLAIDAAADNFVWRPYSVSEEFKFYPKTEKQITVCPGMHEDYASFVKFIRVTELVGLNCVKPYFPHRVSMQFGMDQDIPGNVARCNETPDIAWGNYTRLIGDEKLFIPSRLFKSAVTTRYLEWWKDSKLIWENVIKVNDAKLVSETDSPRSKKNKDMFKETDEAVKESDYKKKMNNEKKGLIIDGGNKLPDDEKSSQWADSKIPQYPTGFEPKEVIENMLTRHDEVVEKHTVEGKVETEVTDIELETRIGRLEMLVAQLKQEGLGHGSA